MNTGLESEAKQFDWLASQLAHVNGKPVALFLHKPLYLHTPGGSGTGSNGDPLCSATRARRLVEMFGAVDLRLVACGHVHQRRDFTYRHIRQVWSPSVGFIISERGRNVIGVKETGLVEYRFRPDSFEVRHVRAKGQVDIDLDSLFRKAD